MSRILKIGDRFIGEGHPVFIIAEIGINHNGSLEIAKKLIDTAALAGCDAVKFQKRSPDLCVPPKQREIGVDTPWGIITYLEYRHRVEFDFGEYCEIDRYCKEKGIKWFASCWDLSSVDFMEQFHPPCHKIASASLTDAQLIRYINKTNRSIILSTGMSTLNEIKAAFSLINKERVLIAHCTSSYPCENNELNLRMIQTLKQMFNVPIGYSGHERGLQATIAAAAMGACFIERHITLDRTMWGSDQAASIEPWGLMRLVRDIRVVETALGDGRKKVYKSELKLKKKLRKIKTIKK